MTIALCVPFGVQAMHELIELEEQEPYVALVSSTYVRDECGWRLVVHQQTPV